MSIDATVGGENANSYVTADEANSYMGGRLHTDAWKTSAGQKEKALRQAARILDNYVEWKGVKTDEAQAMAWPRQYVPDPEYREIDYANFYFDAGDYFLPENAIPQRIKDAQCELALHLLSQDSQTVPDTAGYSQIEVEGAVNLSVDKQDRTDVIPQYIWRIVYQFGTKHGKGGVKLERK